MRQLGLLCLAGLLGTAALHDWAWSDDRRPVEAEQRAVRFLSAEVASWSARQQCYSCHNNGDAARTLLVAIGRSHQVDRQPLVKTLNWLRRPDAWEQNGPQGEFNDTKLARLQFAAALAAAFKSGAVRDREPLRAAAEQLVADQRDDGSWQSDDVAALGSPITYGRFLATAMAAEVLGQADPQRFAEARQKAGQWLRRQTPRSVLAAAAMLHGLAGDEDPSATDLRAASLELIRRGQAPDGGWGPFVTSAPEPFDTAVVVLALATLENAAAQSMLRRGREFLIVTQLDDGSWPETTRPANRESYAHRVSTTAWAALALLRTPKQPATAQNRQR